MVALHGRNLREDIFRPCDWVSWSWSAMNLEKQSQEQLKTFLETSQLHVWSNKTKLEPQNPGYTSLSSLSEQRFQRDVPVAARRISFTPVVWRGDGWWLSWPASGATSRDRSLPGERRRPVGTPLVPGYHLRRRLWPAERGGDCTASQPGG